MRTKKKNRNESRVKRYWVNKILNKTDMKPTGERERERKEGSPSKEIDQLFPRVDGQTHKPQNRNVCDILIRIDRFPVMIVEQ